MANKLPGADARTKEQLRLAMTHEEAIDISVKYMSDYVDNKVFNQAMKQMKKGK